MNQDRLLERIEILWNSYWQKQSARLFNHSTDMFMDYILSIPYCRFVLKKLKDDYLFTDEQYNEYKQKEWGTFVEQKNNLQILSFLLQWYEKRRSEKKYYYQDCKCLGYDKDASEADKMQMFKIDVIRPIVDYIVFNHADESYILYLLNRYVQRIKLFENEKIKIQQIGNNTNEDNFLKDNGDMQPNESVLQKDLCLYLFNSGIRIHQEEVVGNGRLDILVNHNKEYFIVEVKYIKKTEKRDNCIKRINASISQIKEYMSSKGAKNGCILIYTEIEIDFIPMNINENNISMLSVYIGKEVPSKIKFEPIKISI